MGRQRLYALSLLKELSSEVLVPVSVRDEVFTGRGRRSGIVPFQLPDWVSLREDVTPSPDIAGWDLGAGESQVLAHAMLSGSEAVLDDLQARSSARVLGVPTTGTLGVILRAKRAKLVPAARPLIEELLRKGLYLSRDLVEQALVEIGE